MSTLKVESPGKLMLLGEYSILEGKWATVAAINRKVRASVLHTTYSRTLLSERKDLVLKEAEAARIYAEQRHGEVGFDFKLNNEALREGGKKLGLGSSSALTAATVGAVYAQHGLNLSSAAIRKDMFEDALKGHREISPQGSGADVAASIFGGVLRVKQEKDTLRVEPWVWPEGWKLSVIWTKQEAQTHGFVRRFLALKEQAPAFFSELVDDMGQASESFMLALQETNLLKAHAAIVTFAGAMEQLGMEMDSPIMTKSLLTIQKLAAHYGGAAKPSGAGGGDIAIALFANTEKKHAFEQACIEKGLRPLELSFDMHGTRIVPANEYTA